MKRAAKRITLYFWLAIAAVQLLFAARLAPAKSAFVPENRTWQIFPLAAQAHQLNPSQVSEPQRQRPPPPLKTALGELLGPETNLTGVGGAQNVVNGLRLADQLTLESANSPFTSTGELTQSAIDNSTQLFAPGTVGNPNIPSNLGKFTTPTYQSPSGPFQVHFYMDPQTGEVWYNLDYKVKFNSGIK
jgi:hypothetical protein